MTVKDITEGQVQRALARYLGGTSGQCQTFPNIMHGAFERDMLRLMKSGYWHEIEIKRTVSDFRADFKKSYESWFFKDNQSRTKHEVLQSTDTPFKDNDYAQGLRSQPKRFFFALPKGVVDNDEVPKQYGIMRYYLHGPKERSVLIVRTERKAKDLPNPQKIDSETKQRFMTSMYYRYWAHAQKGTKTNEPTE